VTQPTHMPHFRAEFSLVPHSASYGGSDLHGGNVAPKVAPARIVCSSNALAISCMILGGPFYIFPCFGNEVCVLAHAGLANPACFTCTVT